MSRRTLPFILVIIIVAIAAFLGGIYADHLPAVIRLLNSPTPTPTDTPTLTPTLAPTDTATATPTNTPTSTATATPTVTKTPTVTRTATSSPTLTPSDTPTPSLTLTPTNAYPFGGKWKMTNNTSSFDSKPFVLLEIAGDRPVTDGTISAIAYLYIRCKDDQFDIFVATGVTLSGSGDFASTKWRFDLDPIQETPLARSSSNKGLFFAADQASLDTLLKHQTLALQFIPQGPAANTETTFDLRGLSDVVNPFLTACNLATLTPTPTLIRLPTLTPSIAAQTATLTPIAP